MKPLATFKVTDRNEGVGVGVWERGLGFVRMGQWMSVRGNLCSRTRMLIFVCGRSDRDEWACLLGLYV